MREMDATSKTKDNQYSDIIVTLSKIKKIKELHLISMYSIYTKVSLIWQAFVQTCSAVTVMQQELFNSCN